VESADAVIDLHALGSVAVTSAGRDVAIGGARQRRLLAMLLIHRDSVVSSDRLIDAVFAGEPTRAAATTLRSYVARIRRVIGRDSSIRLETTAPGYRLVVPDDRFDVPLFESQLAAARAGLSGADVSGAVDALRAALGLWRGRPYAEFADEDWARPEAQRLEELRLVAYELLFEAELALGRSGEAVAELEVLHDEQPLREGFTERLMVALYRTGRQVEALRVFKKYRRLLGDELGLDPSPVLLAVEQRILQHDASLLDPGVTGQTLRGYRLAERLGAGTDGAVVAVRVPGGGRDLVMRMIGPAVADDPGFIRRFEARVRMIAGIRHAGIVPIYDYWREVGGAYVVVARLRGGSLDDRLRRSPLTRAELQTLVERVGGALVAAAERGIVHGQVSARNVLFDHGGVPFLSDFALVEIDGISPHRDVVAFADVVTAAADPGTREALGRALASAGELEAMSDLVDALLSTLMAEPPAPAALLNPYKGLLAFDEADAADYFGRDGIVTEILERLDCDRGACGRLVVLVGGSGTGKSSLVRAGLLPRLRDGGASGSAAWFVSTMLPGATPFDELAESIARVAAGHAPTVDDVAAGEDAIHAALVHALPEDGQLLLVIDQFEELFILTPDAERHAFLAALVVALTCRHSRLRVVATLRGDFYDRPLGVPGLGAVVRRATVAMAAMTPADLEAAIVRPAERVGRKVEGPLVAELVSAGGTDAAALPALQFALYELAERCGETLTLDAYREIGGIAGAIAERAESLFRAHPEEQTEIKWLFEQLARVAADGDTTRRPAPRAELAVGPGGPSIDGIVERWAGARLLTLDRDPRSRLPTVELAHEALLRQWPRLRGWIDDDRTALLLLGQVREGAADWEALGRDEGALLRGARLSALDEVLAIRPQRLSTIEQAFVDASREVRETEQRAASDRLAAQVRTNRRLRRQLIALGAALALAVAGGVVAISQRRAAENERRVATARELAAAADASVADDAERATLLALAAVDETGGGEHALRESVEALHRAVTSSRLLLNVPDVGGALSWSPDGSVFVTEGPEGTGLVDIRDATTGASVRSWKGHDIDINDVALNPDGTLVATAGDDAALRVWDVATGELREQYTAGDGDSVWAPAFSRDGARVAAAWGGRVHVFDLGEHEPVVEFDAPAAGRISFNMDGTRLAWGRVDGPVATVGDIPTGEIVLKVGGEERWIYDVAYSRDGRRLATSGGDGVARIWDAETGALIMPVVGHSGPVEAVAWGPDGTTLATGSDDGTARLWDVSGSVARELVQVAGSGTRSGIADVAFSPDGEQLMTGDWSVTATDIWDVGPLAGSEWANMASRPESKADLVFVGDDVAASIGRAVRLWDGSTGDVVADIGRESAATRPDDPEAAVAEITDAMTTAYDGAVPITDKLSLIDDPADIAEAIDAVTAPSVQEALTTSRVSINRIEFVAGDEARIRYDVFTAIGDHEGQFGAAVLTPEGWKITRATFCADLAALGVDCGETSDTAWGAVDRMSASPDGQLLATSNGFYPVEIWDVRSGRLLTTVDATEADVAVIDMAWSPDGEQLAVIAGGDGCWVSIVDRSGTETARLENPETCLKTVAFSPDGQLIAATRWPEQMGAGLGGTDVWDWATGELRFATDTDADDGTFDPTGELLATTSELSGTIDLWNVDSGEHVRSLESAAPSKSIDFDPAGTILAAGGLDGVIRLWRVDDGTIVSMLDARAASIRSLVYSADGSRLASVDDDGIVRVWALEVDDLVQLAQRRVTRHLTDDECRQYLHTDTCA
jgi:WD40 repeat protein/DNA-binding SARP family transcriptional activator